MNLDMTTRTTPNGKAPGTPHVGPPEAGQQCAVQPVDLTRILVTAEVVLGAVVVADRLARRPASARARVVMGPGGWVSMKGGEMSVRPGERLWRRRTTTPSPALSPSRRPWWAMVLSARALQTLS